MCFTFATFWSIQILFYTKLLYTNAGKFQVQLGVENFPQYGHGPGPGAAAWGAYDMQRAQGHR